MVQHPVRRVTIIAVTQMVQLQLLFATVLATLASTSAFTRPHAGLTRPAFAFGPRSAVAGGSRRASTGAVTMMAEGDADPKEKKGAVVNIVGEGARGGCESGFACSTC